MKTNQEILAGQLGEALGDMTRLADEGRTDDALAAMERASKLVNQVRRAGGMEDAPLDKLATIHTQWRKMIADRVRGAKRTA